MKAKFVFLVLTSMLWVSALHAQACPAGAELLKVTTSCTPTTDKLDTGNALLENDTTSPITLTNTPVRAYFANVPSGKNNLILALKDQANGEVNIAKHEVSTCTSASLQNANDATQFCELTADIVVGSETLKPADVSPGYKKKFGDVDIEGIEFKGSGKSVKVLAFKNPTAESLSQPESKNEGGTCTPGQFQLSSTSKEFEAFKVKCEAQDELCLTPSGQVIHLPEMEEGRRLNVVLYHPETSRAAFKLEAKFKRQVLMDLGDIYGREKVNSGTWLPGPQSNVKLSGAGDLTVVIEVLPTDKTPLHLDGGMCSVTKTLTTELTYEVTGHYHFMMGIMPTYAGLFDRKYTLHASDDGVQRLYAQDRQQVDLALTLSAYPWGVSPDDFMAVGLVLGTSLRDLGERWYFGIELSSPIGFGITAGPALVLVPKVDKDFVEGQPLAGTQVPTHNTVVPTWFIGVDIQAELFRRAFKGLADDE